MQAGVRARVLVAEDDPALSDVVCTYLGDCGYGCTPAFSGTEARLLLEGDAAGASFDLVITDLMLPGLPGEALVGLVRSRGGVPVIVTSARAQVADRVALLRIGADDYLTKPFDLEELLARVEACLRRADLCKGASPRPEGAHAPFAAENPAGPGLRFGTWRADEETRSFTVAGEPVRLTRTEFDIVCAMMRRPRKVFSKRELFECVRHEGAPADCADEKTVATHVGNIRAKLRPTGTHDCLQIVWGIGFKLEEGGA